MKEKSKDSLIWKEISETVLEKETIAKLKVQKRLYIEFECEACRNE